MADSLVLGNSIELLGGGVTSTIPACAGAAFRLGQGFDLSAPQPTTDFVASLILDGERPFGRRASNRTITLPVLIVGTNRANLAAAREVLEQAIDQDQWTLTWTRDPGPGGTPLPLILDCFRAQPTVPVYNTLEEKQLNMASLTLTIPALPYGRSDTQQQLSFASPVPASPPPPPAAVVLDTYTTIASTQATQSTQSIVGPYTAMWDPDSPLVGDPGGQRTPFTYGPVTFSSPQNLTGLPALQLWLGFGSRYYQNLDYRGRTHGVQVAVTLTDTSGNTLSFSRSNLRLAVTPVAQSPVFSQVTVPVPQGSTTFNYASVASYTMTVTNRQYPVPRLGWVTAYLDHLTAVPPSQQAQPVTRGYLYTLAGLQGTARAPVSLAFAQPPTAGTPTTLSTAGAGNYTVPAGTSWLDVTSTGGGGPGATMTQAGIGGGGAGARCAREPVFPASPGQQIPYVVGAGGQPGASPTPGQASVFGPGPAGPLQVIANGGGAAAENSPDGGTPGQGSGNSIDYPGGAGRTNPAGTVGGGGGSSAGPSGPGNYPVGTAQQVFTTPGTTMWTCPAGVTQITAIPTGAAGSGATGSGFEKGSAGGGGECRQMTQIPVTPGNSYPVVVGAGGAAVTGSGVNGNAGGSSSFTGDGAVAVTAEGGQGGTAGWDAQGGEGGTGGTGGSGWAGGQGGPGSPYGGGGGSSAAPGAPGNAGGSPSGAVAPPGGGAGGNAGSGSGTAGTAPGGGGGGTTGSGTSGAGANGQVILVYPASSGAPTNAGGAAVTGGGAGGQGGGSPGTAGSPGSAPGGGGGGADSSGSTVQGGDGATGRIIVTPYASEPFKSLIVHRPPYGAPKTFQPLVSVGAGGDAPDGTHQYAMPQPVGGVNATFQGTYTLYLIAASWSGGATSTTDRTITVTVTQYEYGGGASYTLSTAPVVLSPSQITNGIVTAGVLTLPIKQLAADNTGGYYTVSVTDSNTSDRFYDLLFLDTQGSTVCINEPSTGYVNYFIDEADPITSLGNIMGSQNGRPDAISVTDVATISGPGLCVEPADGQNLLFVYSADGVAPSVACSFFPRYFFDRFEL
jgi:hypothetical protein